MLKWLKLVSTSLMFCFLTNCTALDRYERRYGITYYDDQDNKIEASITLMPIQPLKIEAVK